MSFFYSFIMLKCWNSFILFLSGEEGPKGGENETRREIHVGYC
jgi:hypothetical protein